MATPSGAYRSDAAGLHRRDLDEDEHGPAAGPGTQRRTPARGAAPFGHRNTSTFIAALRHDRIDAPRVFDGPVNGDIFRTCIERVLVPTLRPGDVVVMDNLASHKTQAVRGAIRSAGAHLLFLLFLPPCSPDLNPIEQAFARLKHWIRTAAPRSRDTLVLCSPRLLCEYEAAAGPGSRVGSDGGRIVTRLVVKDRVRV